MKKYFAASFLLFFVTSLFPKNLELKRLKSVAETQALSKSVVDLFQANNISEAIVKLEDYWPIPQNEIDELKQNTIKYLNIISTRFGEAIGNEKVKNEVISDFAIRETYILRYEMHAIRLVFTYYKGNKGWLVNSFKWDDSFEKEFQQK